MDSLDKREILRGIRTLTDCAHVAARNKGWWQNRDINDVNVQGTLLMLIVSECAEALDWTRHGNPASDHIPEYSGVAEELADVVIRVADMAEAMGIDLAGAVLAKMDFNLGREQRHGGLLA